PSTIQARRGSFTAAFRTIARIDFPPSGAVSAFAEGSSVSTAPMRSQGASSSAEPASSLARVRTVGKCAAMGFGAAGGRGGAEAGLLAVPGLDLGAGGALLAGARDGGGGAGAFMGAAERGAGVGAIFGGAALFAGADIFCSALGGAAASDFTNVG